MLREQLAPAGRKIEPLDVKDEPRIVRCTGAASEQSPPHFCKTGSIRFHNTVCVMEED